MIPPGGAAFTGEGSSDPIRLSPDCLQVVLHLGLQILTARAKDCLHTVSDHDNATGAERFQFVRAGFGDVSKLDAQARDARVKADDV